MQHNTHDIGRSSKGSGVGAAGNFLVASAHQSLSHARCLFSLGCVTVRFRAGLLLGDA